MIHAKESHYKSDITSSYRSRVGNGALVMVIGRAIQSVTISIAVNNVQVHMRSVRVQASSSYLGTLTHQKSRHNLFSSLSKADSLTKGTHVESLIFQVATLQRMAYSREKVAGMLFFVAAAQFVLGLAIAEALYPGYSVSENYISDLGELLK